MSDKEQPGGASEHLGVFCFFCWGMHQDRDARGYVGDGGQACGDRMLGRKKSENDSRARRHPEGSVGWLWDVVTE